ncbi:hypothetical protein IQ06DRAFT_351442 [Phaeosphaeriaceae sp. SRC1lsM3a]|nr:hypothetical protein IQ06DRAFT_351442 [Stagonospora sp. SRC1lsM3a]
MGVTGKRRVKAPVSPTVSPNLGQYKLPYAESEFDTSSHSDSSIAEDVPPTSERAKRARRRASLDARKRAYADSTSSEDEPVANSSLLCRRNIPDLPKKKVRLSSEAVNKHFKDTHAFESELSPRFQTHSVPPHVRSNIFARQSSLSQASPTSIRSSNPSPLSNTTFFTQLSPTDVYLRNGNNKRGSLPEDEPINQKGALADFARRLSAHAQTLADRNYDAPESDDSEP